MKFLVFILFLFFTSCMSISASDKTYRNNYRWKEGGDLKDELTVAETANVVPSAFVMMGNSKAAPVLEIKTNGDVLRYGKKLGTDKEIFEGLKAVLKGCSCHE